MKKIKVNILKSEDSCQQERIEDKANSNSNNNNFVRRNSNYIDSNPNHWNIFTVRDIFANDSTFLKNDENHFARNNFTQDPFYISARQRMDAMCNERSQLLKEFQNRDHSEVFKNDPFFNRDHSEVFKNDPFFNKDHSEVFKNDPFFNKDHSEVFKNDPFFNKDHSEVFKNDPFFNRNNNFQNSGFSSNFKFNF
jgi:hypothetical protein